MDGSRSLPGLDGNSGRKETRNQLEILNIAEFERLSARLQFVQFDEHLTPIGGGNEEKIDSRAIRPSTSCRINSINSKFFLQDLHGAIDVGTAIFHLLDALSKFCQIFCDGPGAAGLARGQNVQGNSLGKMKLKFLGILIRWHIGESGRAIGNSDSPKRIALHR